MFDHSYRERAIDRGARAVSAGGISNVSSQPAGLLNGTRANSKTCPRTGLEIRLSV